MLPQLIEVPLTVIKGSSGFRSGITALGTSGFLIGISLRSAPTRVMLVARPAGMVTRRAVRAAVDGVLVTGCAQRTMGNASNTPADTRTARTGRKAPIMKNLPFTRGL